MMVSSSPNSKASTSSKAPEKPSPAPDSFSNNNYNIINTPATPNYALSTEDAFYSLPSTINNNMIQFAYPSSPSTVPPPASSPSSSLPPNPFHLSSSVSPSKIVEEKPNFHPTTHFPSRDISPVKIEDGITKRENTVKKVDIKVETKQEKEKENPIVFQDPNNVELDGTFSFSFLF